MDVDISDIPSELLIVIDQLSDSLEEIGYAIRLVEYDPNTELHAYIYKRKTK